MEKRWRAENAEILKTRLTSWYKTTKNDSLAAREPMFKRTRNASAIIEDNTVKTTGNG